MRQWRVFVVPPDLAGAMIPSKFEVGHAAARSPEEAAAMVFEAFGIPDVPDEWKVKVLRSVRMKAWKRFYRRLHRKGEASR